MSNFNGKTIEMSGPLLKKPDGTVLFHRVSNTMATPDWEGVYSAIDPLDGGVITLSIDKDKSSSNSENFKLRFRDTYIRACTKMSSDALDGWEGDGPSYSKRGIYLADATTVATSDDEQSLVSLDGSNSEIPISIYCFSGPNDAIQPFAALYNAK